VLVVVCACAAVPQHNNAPPSSKPHRCTRRVPVPHPFVSMMLFSERMPCRRHYQPIDRYDRGIGAEVPPLRHPTLPSKIEVKIVELA
jgi:hypothetical protein